MRRWERVGWSAVGAVAGAIAGYAAGALTARKRRTAPAASATDLPLIAENRSDTLYAWRGPAILIVNAAGAAAEAPNAGFYFRQTRYLRELRLEFFGEPPFPCSSAETGPNRLEFAYVYPEKIGGGSDRGGERHGIPYEDLDIRLVYTVHANRVEAEARIVSRWLERVEVEFAWIVAADFADYGEVYGERKQTAEVAAEAIAGGVRFRYLHPRLALATEARVEGGGPWEYRDGRLAARVTLDRQRECRILLTATAIDQDDAISDRDAGDRDAALRRWEERLTAVASPAGAPIAAITNRAMRDLGWAALLEGPEEEWLTPAAGMPLFQSLWSRDALTAAWQATAFDRGALAAAVLAATARRQGVREDPSRDEQPGRLMRGVSTGLLARLGLAPAVSYADYAAPFAFLFTLGQLYAWSGDEAALKRHFDSARRICDWARDYGDLDRDGYLEYRTLSPDGPKHQGGATRKTASSTPTEPRSGRRSRRPRCRDTGSPRNSSWPSSPPSWDASTTPAPTGGAPRN